MQKNKKGLTVPDINRRAVAAITRGELAGVYLYRDFEAQLTASIVEASSLGGRCGDNGAVYIASTQYFLQDLKPIAVD